MDAQVGTAPFPQRRRQASGDERNAEAKLLRERQQAIRDAEEAHVAYITAAARRAAETPYVLLANDDELMYGLLEWYYLRNGNRGMAHRMRIKDSIPRVELSLAQKLARACFSNDSPTNNVID